MKLKSILLFCFAIFYGTNAYLPAQTAPKVPEMHKFHIFLDNIYLGVFSFDKDQIPKIILDNYYKRYIDFSSITESNIFPTGIQRGFISDLYGTRDASDIGNRPFVHLLTKYAKDGYIYINKVLTENIRNLGRMYSDFTIEYQYDNTPITTEEDVMRMVRLKKKNIQALVLVIDEQRRMITIDIKTKKGSKSESSSIFVIPREPSWRQATTSRSGRGGAGQEVTSLQH